MHTKIVTIVEERVEIVYDNYYHVLVLANFHGSYHRDLIAVTLIIPRPMPGRCIRSMRGAHRNDSLHHRTELMALFVIMIVPVEMKWIDQLVTWTPIPLIDDSMTRFPNHRALFTHACPQLAVIALSSASDTSMEGLEQSLLTEEKTMRVQCWITNETSFLWKALNGILLISQTTRLIDRNTRRKGLLECAISVSRQWLASGDHAPGPQTSSKLDAYRCWHRSMHTDRHRISPFISISS